MDVKCIIASGALGVESAALDVAIRLKISFRGYTFESSLVDGPRMPSRYGLPGKPFADDLARDQFNLQQAQGTLIFHGADQASARAALREFATAQHHPCLSLELNAPELEAAVAINRWAARHDVRDLFVTGATIAEDANAYQNAYDRLYRALMMGRERYPAATGDPMPHRRPLPQTVDQAVAYLLEELSLKDKVRIANMHASELAELNAHLGEYIRNKFALWGDNPRLLESCAQSALKVRVDAEEASAVVIALLSLALEKSHKLRPV
jgi:hypothetical protein